MSMSDPLGDLLTRIRNAQSARQSRCKAPASKLRENVLEVLKREGYIPRLAHRGGAPWRALHRYRAEISEGEPAIKEITRVSKPGRRVYSKDRGAAEVLQRARHVDPLHAARRDSENEARAANVAGRSPLPRVLTGATQCLALGNIPFRCRRA